MMIDVITSSPLFGLFFTALCWSFGHWVQKKTGFILFNHLLVAVAVGIVLLIALDIPYEQYYATAAPITHMLAPATAILGLNIYRKRLILKQYFIPVFVGCLVGCLTSLGSVFLLCHLMTVDSVLTASLLPKSVTTAIAMSLAETRSGVGGIAAGAVMVAGLMSPIFSTSFAKWFHITDPVAEGLAIGASSHALGTSRAIEIGEIQGAMSSIALCICGIMTSVLMLLF